MNHPIIFKNAHFWSCHPNQLTTRLFYVNVSILFKHFIIIIIILFEKKNSLETL